MYNNRHIKKGKYKNNLGIIFKNQNFHEKSFDPQKCFNSFDS